MNAQHGICVHRIDDMAAEELAANAENVYKNAVYHNDPAPTAPTNTNHTTRLAMQVLWTEYLTAEAADRLPGQATRLPRQPPHNDPPATGYAKNSKLCNSVARARVFSATVPRAHSVFSATAPRARVFAAAPLRCLLQHPCARLFFLSLAHAWFTTTRCAH